MAASAYQRGSFTVAAPACPDDFYPINADTPEVKKRRRPAWFFSFERQGQWVAQDAGCGPRSGGAWRLWLAAASLLLLILFQLRGQRTTGMPLRASVRAPIHRAAGAAVEDTTPLVEPVVGAIPWKAKVDSSPPDAAGAMDEPERDQTPVRVEAASEEEAATFFAASPGAVSTKDKQRAIAAMIRWAWHGYRAHAWPIDELAPLSKHGLPWMRMGVTIVDSLDTLLLAGLDNETAEALRWCETELDVTIDTNVNLFETTIRVVGGLLSAHAMTGSLPLLEKAADLAERMLPAFHTATGIPLSDINPGTHAAHNPGFAGASSMAEATTLRMEYSAAGALARRPQLGAAAAKAQMAVINIPKTEGLAPIYVDPHTGSWSSSTVTLGARGDSYYEYLLKSYLHEGSKDEVLLAAFHESMAGVVNRLLHRSATEGMLFVAEMEGTGGHLSFKMDHLVCFLPALFALAHISGLVPPASTAAAYSKLKLDHSYLAPGAALAETCHEMYRRTPSGLAPEIVVFDSGPGFEASGGFASGDMGIKAGDAHCLLRPEAVESWFLMHRATGGREGRYREWGWDMARNLEKHARVATGGYASLESVLSTAPRKRDKMESFFVAETLKYLLLLFSDDPNTVPLDRFVLNTEAHPLPIMGGPPHGAAGLVRSAMPADIIEVA